MLKFTLLKHNNVSTIDLNGTNGLPGPCETKNVFTVYSIHRYDRSSLKLSSAQHVVMINQPDHSKPTLIDFSQPDVIRP